MALHVWLFECARCHELILLCTRCLGGRQYCDPCGEEAHRESVLECGRRYQATPEGREKHRLRQQQYRARLRERQQVLEGRADSPAAGAYASDSPGPSEPAEPAAASSSPGVTHRSVRQSNDVGVFTIRVPGPAAYAATEHAVRGDDDETEPATKAKTVEEANEACSTPCQREHAPCDQEKAAARARQEAAMVVVRLRNSGGRSVIATCCCCGRTGAVVVYDGKPRIIHGSTHGLDSG